MDAVRAKKAVSVAKSREKKAAELGTTGVPNPVSVHVENLREFNLDEAEPNLQCRSVKALAVRRYPRISVFYA